VSGAEANSVGAGDGTKASAGKILLIDFGAERVVVEFAAHEGILHSDVRVCSIVARIFSIFLLIFPGGSA
jgi:hypothetical protein